MTEVEFRFHEIIDTDYTAVDACICANGQPVVAFRNYDRRALTKVIHANQTERFAFPTFEAALHFIRSNRSYRQVSLKEFAATWLREPV